MPDAEEPAEDDGAAAEDAVADDAAAAHAEARTAEQHARSAERAVQTLEREVHGDTADPQFGRLGRPIRRDSPFMLGFLGALGVFVAWFLIQAVVEARSVIVLIVVAMFLAIGLNPVVEWFVARGLRRGVAIAIVFFGSSAPSSASASPSSRR